MAPSVRWQTIPGTPIRLNEQDHADPTFVAGPAAITLRMKRKDHAVDARRMANAMGMTVIQYVALENGARVFRDPAMSLVDSLAAMLRRGDPVAMERD
jgi:hypothetical protein